MSAIVFPKSGRDQRDSLFQENLFGFRNFCEERRGQVVDGMSIAFGLAVANVRDESLSEEILIQAVAKTAAGGEVGWWGFSKSPVALAAGDFVSIVENSRLPDRQDL
jgi:hypothetical protein